MLINSCVLFLCCIGWYLSLMALSTSAVTPWTCSDIIKRPGKKLHPCFIINDTSTVVCEVLEKPTSAFPDFSEHIYLHIRLTFQISENAIAGVSSSRAVDEDGQDGDPTMPVCLQFSNISVDLLHMNKPWENATNGSFMRFQMFFIDGLESLFIKMNMNSTVPVAVMDVNTSCWNQTRSSTCIQLVTLIADVWNFTMPSVSTPPPSYWKPLRLTYTELLNAVLEYAGTEYGFPLHEISPVNFLEYFDGMKMLHASCKGGFWIYFNDILPRMPFLRVLEIPKNQIYDMRADSFLNIPNVEYMNLADNYFYKVPEELKILKKLRYLDLSRNRFLFWNNDSGITMNRAIGQLTTLKTLILSGITIKYMDQLYLVLKDTNSTFRLEHLDISYCGIRALHDSSVFDVQNSLKLINLSGNKFLSIHPEIFVNLKYIKYINISNISMTTGPNLKLNSNTSLDVLNVAFNELRYPEVVTSGFVNTLDLSWNLLTEWNDTDIFVKQQRFRGDSNSSELLSQGDRNKVKLETWVENVNLSHNHITSVSILMTVSLSVLKSVDLGGNSFDCRSCRTPVFKSWLNDSSPVRVANLGSDRHLTCSQPKSHADVPIVNYYFDPLNCGTQVINLPVDYVLVVGAPLAVLFVVIVSASGAVYRYRFELTYLLRQRIVWGKKNKSHDKNGQRSYKYDAFVCYSRHDRHWVFRKLAARLENSKDRYRLCLHEREFTLGSFILENIEESLYTSRHMIMVLSSHFVSSQWCRLELDMANHRQLEENVDRLILVELERLDRNSLPRRLKFLMDTHTYLEWPQGNSTEQGHEEALWKRLKAALGTSLWRSKSEEASLLVN